ncbi:ParB N-terminal domain-containing protein [Micrococcus luteus]|uniref:ParB N-terminal domain-containing protein n=1 Tax=Micrococcus luteus TaxID=1270 RepID=UPI00117F0501|nr:ParB N-terminal domain-containing protein [Micrococcus luteus]
MPAKTTAIEPHKMLPEFKYLGVSSLDFDPDNPRIPEHIVGKSSDALLKYMLEDANLFDLMSSIATQGFFPGEPILVCPILNGTSDSGRGRYTVIEGNRRYAATLLLRRPELAPEKYRSRVMSLRDNIDDPDELFLPSLIFASRKEILDHLGYRHITGIKEWDPHAKARFLRGMYADLETDVKEGKIDTRDASRMLARSIGSRADYVARLLTSLALYDFAGSEGIWSSIGVDPRSISFSLIPSLLAQTAILDFLGIGDIYSFDSITANRDRLKLVLDITYKRMEGRGGKTRLGDSRNIGALAKILSDPDGVKELEAGSSLDAARRSAIRGVESIDEAVSAVDEWLAFLKSTLPGVHFNEVQKVQWMERLDSAGDALAEVRAAIAS